MVFGCFYRSPTTKANSNENNDNLSSLLKTLALNKKYTHRCFVGDFNFNTINWSNWTSPHGEDSKEERFLESIRDSYLYQHIDEPTRCRGTDNPSIIDLIFTNEEQQISNLNYHAPLGKSDHSVLSFTFHCYIDYKSSEERHLYDSANFNGMRLWLEECEWSKPFVETTSKKSVNTMWNEFKNTLIQLRSLYVPVKKFGDQTWKEKGSIPISKDLRNLIKEKKRLHRKWMKTRDQRNRLNYTKVRNLVKRKINISKRNMERDICNRSEENPKVFWSYVQSHLKTRSGISPLLESVNDKTSIKFSDKEKADILQKQFCSVFTREPNGDLPDFEMKTKKKITSVSLNATIIRKEIENLDPSKAFGPDEIHPKMLKELIDHVSAPLTTIISKTLKNGTLPDDWKNAQVSPIFKKGARNVAANYRPVSLTSIVCKVAEKIIRKKVISHLVKEKLLSPKQHGFISKKSTTTQLLSYLDKCAEIIATGSVVDTIYFDFAKAFDTVPHQRLLKKLQCYGIDGEILRWIEAFLKERHQVVKVNGVESTVDPVLSGIPQGSVLGPLLFLVYINDLPQVVKSDMYLFADDTKIFKRVEYEDDSIILQKDIDAMEKWSHDWLLKFHPGKCHVLTLGKFCNIKHAHRYVLDSVELDHVFLEKDLGVTIDSELLFEEHIAEKVMKANQMVGLIRRSFSYLSPKTFKQLYSAFVRPHLEYAQVVWNPKLRKHVNMIERVQKRATKLIDGYKNLSYGDRLRKLQIPTLEFRRAFGDMVEVYKHLNFYDKSAIPDKLRLRTRPNRKHNLQLMPNFASDGTRGVQKKSFYYRCIYPWNELPTTVVNSTSIAVFKKRLDEAWKNHQLRYPI